MQLFWGRVTSSAGHLVRNFHRAREKFLSSSMATSSAKCGHFVRSN